jgi:hypothetical protein
MYFRFRTVVACAAAALLAVGAGTAQQVIQRGALGVPGSVLDETQSWSAPLSVASDKQVEIFIPDVSRLEWLQRNYDQYQSKGTFTLTLFTFYKSEEACRANRIGWGLGDADHLNACAAIAYRVRQGLIDPQSKTVTLQMAAMVDSDGNIDPDSMQHTGEFRTWDQLDPNTLAAVKKASGLVAQQMTGYDRKLRTLR